MITIRSEQEMKEFGAKLGTLLNGSEVIELVGDVGAGKTTFVRGLAEGLGIQETVQSPSFTINRVYDGTSNRRLSHYDFYRLDEAGIMADELDEAVHDPETVVVVEWANAVATVLPEERLTLIITALGESGRNVDISAHGERASLLKRKYMILLLDTTTSTARLVFVKDGMYKNFEWQAERELAKGLLRWIKECLDTEVAQFSDITGIGVNRGPGSFTGIRIGLTVMNTLAESLQVPIVGAIGESWKTQTVNSLQAGQNERVVLPYYDRAATITSPRK